MKVSDFIVLPQFVGMDVFLRFVLIYSAAVLLICWLGHEGP